MDGDGKNGHVNQGLGQALQTINLPVSSFISQHNTNPAHSANETVVLQIQQLLEQLNGRGLNSMLVVVDPVGNVSIHGSEKGQLFLKDNADIADRFAKICSDDVWTLLGAQKRFLEIGRQQNHNKSNGDYPIDFSHERANYFPTQTITTDRGGQDNAFVQGILSQSNQNKSYQNNPLFQTPFGQFDSRQNSSTFFQGGFNQGVTGTDAYPQPNFMSGMDVTANSHSNQTVGVPSHAISIVPSVSDKPNGMNQTEDDLIKEMLSSTAIPEGLTIKPVGNAKKSPKAKFVESDKSDAAKKKRERRPETWQRNIKKKLKTEGREYVNAKGKLVPAKAMRPVDCSKCKQRCTDKISEDTRKKIFDWFWKLGSYTAQKEFVVSRVTQVATRTSKRRQVHRLFSFEINGKYESVCKPFFARTLGIGDSYIYKAFEQKARDLFVQDGRGKHAPVNKTSLEQVETMHSHLDRHLVEYPTNQPLPKNVHAVKWYDEYVVCCTEEGKKPVSKHIYRKIFQDYTKRFPPQPEKKKVDQSSQDKPENRKGAMSWDTEPVAGPSSDIASRRMTIENSLNK
ncbi:uncharacterized protein LOC128208260 [Mya arenaria]|uniref:uncharacterized protein LOC128208260 n=1 Tax=Mya arenaria TaxID=6604 RepID=UPI0022DF5B81|nr:uncharacterized protein LOC128208260 [Mya arenaria]